MAKLQEAAVIRFRNRNETKSILQREVLNFLGLTAETIDFLNRKTAHALTARRVVNRCMNAKKK